MSKEYTCGTLKYTPFQLIMVIFWLMVGGFTFAVCIGLPDSILPVQLKNMEGVSDIQRMIILNTISGVLNMTVCPYVGFVSDRHRGKWGRRIPYILFSLPFLVLALFCFGVTDKIGGWLSSSLAPWCEIAPVTLTVCAIMGTMVLFKFFYMYVGSVIWYIFNDVIPPEFFARTMALFNVATSLATALYNFFVFKYVAEHRFWVFLGGAILYGVGMTLMCLFVKEGEYPPIEDGSDEKKKTLFSMVKEWGTGLKVFVRESFCHQVYIYHYLLAVLNAVCSATCVYGYNFNKEIGISDEIIGKLSGVSGMIGSFGIMIVAVVASSLVNKWHPVRIMIYFYLYSLTTLLTSVYWIFGTVPEESYFYLTLIPVVGGLFLNSLRSVAGLPFEMLTFPKSRFGSFCSMQALLASVTTIVMGIIAGMLFDFLNSCFVNSNTFHYRFVHVWQLPPRVLTILVAVLMYRVWARLGGYTRFECPAVWDKSGKELMECPPGENVSRSLLKWALYLVDALNVLMLLLCGYMAFHSWRLEQAELAAKYLYVCGGASVAGCVIWLFVRLGIMADLRRVNRGDVPHNGLPHHGMLLLFTIYQMFYAAGAGYLLLTVDNPNIFIYLLLAVLQIIVLSLTTWGACKMEKGISTTVQA